MSESANKYARVKNSVLLALSGIVFVLLIVLPVISRTLFSVEESSGIRGFNIFALLFSGEMTYASPLGFEILYKVPAAAVIMLAVGILAVLAAAIFAAVSLLRGANGKKAGYAAAGAAAYLLIAYIILLLAEGIKGIDEDGTAYAFYRLFTLNPVILIAILVLFLSGAVGIFLDANKVKLVKRFMPLYLILAIPTLFILVFSIYPIFLQMVLTFKNYNGVEGVFNSKWFGLNNFTQLFEDPMMGRIIFNTVWINFLRLFIKLIPPIILSIFLFEIRSDRLRKIIQAIIYTPHFFSWVVVFAICVAFLDVTGVVNNLLLKWGWVDAPISFLQQEGGFIPIQLITLMWKELGWSTILFVAALGGIDPSQYEAASIDGAGPLKKMWHITLPGMLPVIVFLTVIEVGNLLRGAGGEQILLFKNPSTNRVGQMIDTWVYEVGLRGSNTFGLASAISFVQSVIGIIMVVLCNKFSRKATGFSMW